MQNLSARETVGLEGDNDAPSGENHMGRRQSLLYFVGMVAVVIYYSHTIALALVFEPPANALESGQSLPDFLKGDLTDQSDADRSQRIQNIVPAGLRQHDLTKLFVPAPHLKAVQMIHFEGHGAKLVLAAEAVRDHRTLHPGKQCSHARIIAADHIRSVERNVVHEVNEGVVQSFTGFVVIEMILVHVGNHVDDRQEAEEGSVGFISFGNKIITMPKMGISAVYVEASADDDSGIKAGRIENAGREGSRSCLTVSTGDGDSLSQAHEFGQHFSPRNNGDAASAGLDDLGVVIADGRGLHKDVLVIEVLCQMAYVHIGSQAPEVTDSR